MVRVILSWGLVAMLLLSLGACSSLSSFETQTQPLTKQQDLNIAMLHIAPRLAKSEADIAFNAALIELGMRQAKAHGARWVMTPELALTGYKFNSEIGTSWITSDVDVWTRQLQQVADELELVLFLSHLEEDEQTKRRFNTLFVINQSGDIIARHRKINTIPGSESWSTKGEQATVVDIDNIKVGLLICADAWPEQHANSLKAQGAEVMLSSANWPPGQYGPGETWEKRVQETGLAIFVNNRTGKEKGFDMSEGESIVSSLENGNAQRLFSHSSSENYLLLLNYNLVGQRLSKATSFKL